MAVRDIALTNLLMLATGVGLLPFFGARSLAGVASRLPLAYAVGFAAVGVLDTELVVLGVPIGWTSLVVVAILALAAGAWKVERTVAWPRRVPNLPALGLLAVATVFLVQAGRMLTVKPLLENDGWAIWGLRARALYDFGGVSSPVFTDTHYQALQHPLLLPALEALDFHTIGRFDGTVVHLQLLGFAVALCGGVWTLLRPHCSQALVAATLLAILTAPAFFGQLGTNYADIPLATFVALGVTAAAVWLVADDPAALRLAALFLAAAALAKNEGEMFTLALFVAAAVFAGRSRLKPLGLAAVALALADAPWRVWIAAHHVKVAEYSLTDLFDPRYLSDHADRVGPSAHELLRQIFGSSSWSYLVPLALLGIGGAAATRRVRLAAFAALWLVLAFAGLVTIYWISNNPIAYHLYNSANRTIDTLIVGAAALVPLLLSGGAGRRAQTDGA
jgi:hypothetical protein